MKKMLLGLSLLLAVSTVVHAADTFKAEYVSGKAGFEKKIKGELVIGDDSLTLMDGKKVVFVIPLVTVTKASDTVENNSGGLGRKVMFGNFSNRSEGFVFVSTETADAAEAI